MTQSTPPGTYPPTEVFKPARDHILAIALLSGIALLSISWAPQYLAWLLIIPVLALWWVIKSRTRVSEKGISITYAFRGAKTIDWKDFAGIGFQRAHAFARTTDGQQLSLPGVTFNCLPRLNAASRGRIPDALSAGRAAADNKVVVIHRDGRQVLLNKEDYDEYRAEHPDIQENQK